MSQEFWIAVIGLLGLVVTTLPALLKALSESNKRKLLEVENQFHKEKQTTNQKLIEELKEYLNRPTGRELLAVFDSFYGELEVIKQESNVDRFLILIAQNGIAAPTRTTAVFQDRSPQQQRIDYMEFPLDTDYKSRLARIEASGLEYVIVEELPECAIKDAYELEGVKSSLWIFIKKEIHSGGKADLIYCSFATHSDERFTKHEIIRCKILIGKLRKALS